MKGKTEYVCGVRKFRGNGSRIERGTYRLVGLTGGASRVLSHIRLSRYAAGRFNAALAQHRVIRFWPSRAVWS